MNQRPYFYPYPKITEDERKMDFNAAAQSMRIRLGSSLQDAKRYVAYNERIRIPVPISLSLEDMKTMRDCLSFVLTQPENPLKDSQDPDAEVTRVLRNLDSQIRWILEKI